MPSDPQFSSIEQTSEMEGSDLYEVLMGTIDAAGVISFRDFMDLALYHEEFGYYAQKLDSVGKNGDFVTSVSTGSRFGALLGEQFRTWATEYSGASDLTTWIEAGAHDGRLARDILDYARDHQTEFYPRIRYSIVEPSRFRRRQQEALLQDHLEVVTWYEDWTDVATRSVNGVIFSNELLDAFPVERISWDATLGEWFRWGITRRDQDFEWCRLNSPLPEAVHQFSDRVPADLRAQLPHGYTTECGSAAPDWWQAAADRLRQGHLVAIDYGLTRTELLAPQRHEGTLRAYCNHHLSTDLLANPGQQDLTAHVNFSEIQEAGESAGLNTVTFESQERFLSKILSQLIEQNSESPLLSPDWAGQIKTLLHPNHFGRSFSVFVQKR